MAKTTGKTRSEFGPGTGLAVASHRSPPPTGYGVANSSDDMKPTRRMRRPAYRRRAGDHGSGPSQRTTQTRSPYSGGRLIRQRGMDDQACTALESHIRPQPIEQHYNSVSEAYEESDVDEAPQQPCDAAG